MVDHYRDEYWNDLPGVLRHLCRRATGDPGLWWMDYFKRCYATPPRKRALVFGCGNGWVERDLFDRGVADQFDAFDVSQAYLDQAMRERHDRRIAYFRADFDTFQPTGRYDLLVNVASLHHVRYLYRMLERLWHAIDEHGLFVHWEYVGPSRNQYSDAHVAIMKAVNDSLPERFRTPHPLRHELSTFLAGDPTEAIHAEDILDGLETYFEPVEKKILGGGVAYQILWNNVAPFRSDDPEAQQALEWLLRLDESFTDSGAVPPLFAFIVCRKRSSIGLRAPLQRLVREPVRERFSRFTGGVYPAELWRTNARRFRRKWDGLRSAARAGTFVARDAPKA
jgi:SAM-dependent methyltransferase